MTAAASSVRATGSVISEEWIEQAIGRLSAGHPVRRKLPGPGRLHVDRRLPFLCVYRRPGDGGAEGSELLVTSEAAYLVADGSPPAQRSLRRLVRSLVEAMVREFGAFLLVELSSHSPTAEKTDSGAPARLHFRIVTPRSGTLAGFVEELGEAVRRIRVQRHGAGSETVARNHWCSESLPPLLTASEARGIGCSVIGIEAVVPYRDPAGGAVYPGVLRELRRGLSRVLRRSFFDFSRRFTTHRPRHYHMLGRRAVVKAVWDVDRCLADVADSFDFLIQTNPINAERVWQAFRRSGYSKAPAFDYRPLRVDPGVLKRRLFEAPIERIEDPTLAFLLRQKQDELDRQITMLLDINTMRFVHGSIQVYGAVEPALRELAESLIAHCPARTRERRNGGTLGAEQFARLARAEIRRYRRRRPEFDADVRVGDEMGAGLMVSRGSLLVGSRLRVPASRAEALIQHEVGTHVVTYHNGRAQPLRQLYTGLAGYEALQEGLAVTAEYLVGGLSRPRLRVLAGRVLGVAAMLEGATFEETYELLHGTHGFDSHSAFMMTTRVFRAGGLTKDAVYLRGLRQLLRYLARGGEIEPLLVGKIATEHVPVIRELLWRKVLAQPPVRPRFLDHPGAAARLEHLKGGIEPLDLVEGGTK